eukprot:3843824-Pleurochrysis_carterae.AAC.1
MGGTTRAIGARPSGAVMMMMMLSPTPCVRVDERDSAARAEGHDVRMNLPSITTCELGAGWGAWAGGRWRERAEANSELLRRSRRVEEESHLR